MMAGPGAIATTLLLTGDAGYGPRLAIIIAVVLSVCLLCTLCFIFANMIARSLGRTGNAVLSRVLGMLLAAYSVQFVINGIAAVRASLP
jgi:multiple antibiotic resistance protein